ncbi:MAG: exodeoxyribonuclease VII small subunit [Deltaproteobacteria bacterium]|nr:exodeoxyribonuclease VII small subunit [Deltaproteobacteria bacterium]
MTRTPTRTPAPSKGQSAPKIPFEEALKKLEETVESLEDGEIALEDALKLYEEGVRLARLCTKKLDEAERKIEILSRDTEGKVTARPFEEGAEEGE